MPEKNEKIGALWQRKTKDGQDYFSGEVNGVQVVVFANSYKEAEKQPDWIVLKSKPKGE